MRQQMVIVGAGPRGTGILERLAANAPELYAGPGLDIHLVDPHPPGGGRIWRQAQSPLLWMNSQAEDVTMFTDDTVTMAGPVREGPTLHEWARLDGRTFPDRQLQGRYLRWVYERAVADLPPNVTVHHHPHRALRVGGPREGRQQVWLEGRPRPLLADLVILAVGHLDSELDAEQAELAAYAREHGLVHLPPDFTADSDLSALAPGAPVLVRGFGLAFVDLMVLLTEGRGGRYETGGPDGEVYVPSGREPVLYVGSRRGVPYHSKIGYDWTGDRPPLPRFPRPRRGWTRCWPGPGASTSGATCGRWSRRSWASPTTTGCSPPTPGVRRWPGPTSRRSTRRRATPPRPGRWSPPPYPIRPTGSTSPRSTTRWTGCGTPRTRTSRKGCGAMSRPTSDAGTTPRSART